jgi:hypothetical protein
MIVPIPEGQIQELYLSDRELSDDRLIAEAIQAAIKRHLPKFVVLPRNLPTNAIYQLDVKLMTDPETARWASKPELYSLGRVSNTVSLQNALKAIRPAQQWRRIRDHLTQSSDPKDHPVGDAISAQLTTPENGESEDDVVVTLSEPCDWLKRVDAAEVALRSSAT